MDLIYLYVDGASRGNPGLAAIGASLQSPNGEELDSISQAIGNTTNNQAEYTALIEGLSLALKKNFKKVEVRADSELVVRQMKGEYRVKDEKLKPLHEKAKNLSRSFDLFSIRHIPRAENHRADELANQALDQE